MSESKTPPCNCTMSDTFNDYYCERQAWKCCKYSDLELALSESRAECERLRYTNKILAERSFELQTNLTAVLEGKNNDIR